MHRHETVYWQQEKIFMRVLVRKSYEPPTLRTPTRNQATLFLTGYAYLGDRGARDLLELLFPMATLLPDQDQSRVHTADTASV